MRFCRVLPALIIVPGLMVAGCANSSRTDAAVIEITAEQKQRTQFLLQQHNMKTPIVEKTACITALESLLDSITGTQFVFVGYAPERWATGGQQAQFVPFQSRLGYRKQVVTLVIDNFCKIEGLIWPE